MIFFCMCLLLVNEKAIDLYKMIIYSDKLLNLFIISRCFLVDSLVSQKYFVMYRDNWTSSFFTGFPLISFSCLIAEDWTLSRILKRSGEGGCPCLVLTSVQATCIMLLSI